MPLPKQPRRTERGRLLPVTDSQTTLLIVIVFLVSASLAFGLEPHWSSRDGRRFIARAARLDPQDREKWVEVRGTLSDESVEVSTRRSRHAGLNGTYRIVQTATGPRRTVVVHLRGEQEILLRFPRRSRTLRLIESTLEGAGG